MYKSKDFKLKYIFSGEQSNSNNFDTNYQFKIQITNLRSERGDITIESSKIERMIGTFMNNFMSVNLIIC